MHPVRWVGAQRMHASDSLSGLNGLQMQYWVHYWHRCRLSSTVSPTGLTYPLLTYPLLTYPQLAYPRPPPPPGLPPTQYKAWGSEYREEYRSPETRKATLTELTSTHGTADALRATRYQFQGYPHAFKSYAPSSMTARGQVMPDYESRVRAF